jgi:hypothetical protein
VEDEEEEVEEAAAREQDISMKTCTHERPFIASEK